MKTDRLIFPGLLVVIVLLIVILSFVIRTSLLLG